MKNKILILFIVGLFIASSLASISTIGIQTFKENEINNNSINLNENDAEAPVWDVGHYWTYDITINGGFSNKIIINNLKINDIKFTVDLVDADSYYLSFSSGSVTGSVTVKTDIITLSGNFQNTDMQGDIVVNKSKLTYETFEDAIIDGFIKPNILPKIPFSIEGYGSFMYGVPLLNFPINNGDVYFVHDISITLNAEINLLPEPIEELIFIEGRATEVLEWDIVNVAAGEFDALKISSEIGDEHIVWYAVSAGNVVKMRGRDIPFSYGYFGEYDFDIELQSTNFYIESDSPSTPDSLTGPLEVVAGYPEDYIAGGSIDPDGDMVRYIFDWDDGSISGTDFVNSGESATLSKYWSSKGQYNVKVKARDKYGEQSGWSDPIAVTVKNDPPLKPDSPIGPPNGKIKKLYTYSANSTDPDGHRVRYKFDWDDGSTSFSNIVESGEIGSASHSWRRVGDFQIRVKAVDEWGEESEWSDPLPIHMPRNRINIFNKIINFLENYPIIYRLLQYYLNL